MEKNISYLEKVIDSNLSKIIESRKTINEQLFLVGHANCRYLYHETD